MSLIDELQRVRDDSLAALDASHDYYFHTTVAWNFLQGMVRQSHKIIARNLATGNTVDERELSDLARKYVTGHLASATFQHFVSLFEDFVFGFLRAWLTEYPESLKRKQLQFETVLELADRAAIVQTVVQEKLVGIAYKPVEKWFKYLNGIVQLGCPTADQIEQLVEIKASRDILVHNGGIVNSVYVEKAKGRARFKVGEALEVPDRYHRESWQLIRQIVTDIGDAGIEKSP